MKKLVSALILSLSFSLQAQVRTNGGGPTPPNENPTMTIKKIEELADKWMKLIKGRWEKCYSQKLRANTIPELYRLLLYRNAIHPFMDPNCEIRSYLFEQKSLSDCLFQDHNINDYLYGFISDPKFSQWYFARYKIPSDESKAIREYFLTQLEKVNKHKYPR